MAINPKSLKNLKKIQKGEVRNPLGAGAHNQEVKAIKRLTSMEVAEVASLIVKKDKEALKAVMVDPKSSVLKVWMASIAIKGVASGDASRLNALLERVIGKVPSELKLSGEVDTGSQSEIDQLPLEQRLKIMEILKGKK